MRTSNKIIAGIFIVPLVILTLIQAALYAKLQTGHYLAMKTVIKDRFTRHPLNAITGVQVYGLNNFRIIPADSSVLEIENDKNGHLHYTISGNTLVIHGDSTIIRPGRENEIEKNYQEINLYLPGNIAIAADNAEVKLQGSKDSTKANSYQLSLATDANLQIEENGDDKGISAFFRNISIQAAHANNIEIGHHTRIADLQLHVKATDFTDNGASIGKLTIEADSLSAITLKGVNLNKLNKAQ